MGWMIFMTSKQQNSEK